MQSFLHEQAPTPLNLDDAEVRRTWAAEFAVSEERLVAAAAVVGKMPGALRFYLSCTSNGHKVVISDENRARYEERKALRRRKP